jgi:hypothetical protein
MEQEQEFYQYVDLFCESKFKFIRKITTSPFISFNVIVFKPAKYAFWYIFNSLF